jgi:hypothetical protein
VASLFVLKNQHFRFASYPRTIYLCRYMAKCSFIGLRRLDHGFLIPLDMMLIFALSVWHAIPWWCQ